MSRYTHSGGRLSNTSARLKEPSPRTMGRLEPWQAAAAVTERCSVARGAHADWQPAH